jgi:ribose transport system substrate-binding protein
MLRYQEGSASTNEREEGFLDAVKKNPGIQVILDNRYAGATTDEAKTAALNVLDTLKSADGIYCPNESSTFGMLLALRQNNLAGKKKFVGFDTSPQLIEGLQKNEIDGLVAQNPRKMGYEAVKVCVQAIKGEKVEPRIDTGATLVTAAAPPIASRVLAKALRRVPAPRKTFPSRSFPKARRTSTGKPCRPARCKPAKNSA